MIFAKSLFNQFCLSIYCVVGLSAGMPTTICAHVYEDGFVERSLTITIRDGVGYGEYQIGLNAKTADQILKAAQLKQKDARLNLMKEPQASANQHYHLQSQSPSSTAEAVDANEPNKLEKSPDLEPKKTEPKNTTAPKSVASPQRLGTVGSGQHLTDLKTIARFGDLQQRWFTDHLKLVSDGQKIEFSKVSVEPAARHPYSVLVKFQFSLEEKKVSKGVLTVDEPRIDPKSDPPASRVVDLQLTDDVFSEHAGATRYALRARGSTMLLQSNVAPVLVRAERVEVTPKASGDQASSPTIKAKLTVGQ